jgi:hypothetical protein
MADLEARSPLPTGAMEGSSSPSPATGQPMALDKIWVVVNRKHQHDGIPMVRARIPPELHQRLLKVAAQLQVKPSQVMVSALQLYMERLQASAGIGGPDALNSSTTAEILDRLERLERRVEALEAASPHTTDRQRASAALPSRPDAPPVLGLCRLARRVIGLGSDRDPFRRQTPPAGGTTDGPTTGTGQGVDSGIADPF